MDLVISLHHNYKQKRVSGEYLARFIFFPLNVVYMRLYNSLFKGIYIFDMVIHMSLLIHTVFLSMLPLCTCFYLSTSQNNY